MTTDAEPAGAYVTSAQIAAELNIHEQTVQRYFRDGSLPGRKIGKGWRTTRAALDTWIAGGTPAAPGDVHYHSDHHHQTTPPLETK